MCPHLRYGKAFSPLQKSWLRNSIVSRLPLLSRTPAFLYIFMNWTRIASAQLPKPTWKHWICIPIWNFFNCVYMMLWLHEQKNYFFSLRVDFWMYWSLVYNQCLFVIKIVHILWKKKLIKFAVHSISIYSVIPSRIYFLFYYNKSIRQRIHLPIKYLSDLTLNWIFHTALWIRTKKIYIKQAHGGKVWGDLNDTVIIVLVQVFCKLYI